jgi:hypothetical protein
VLLETTLKGKRLLDSLSIDHARELNELAPQLIRTLTQLGSVTSKPAKQARKASNEI